MSYLNSKFIKQSSKLDARNTIHSAFSIQHSVLLILLFTIHYSLFTIFTACDKIEPPFTKQQITPPDTSKNVRHILLEEFTGFKCGNCPRAHKILDSLEKIYGDKLISYAIHASPFAEPDKTGDFTTDFRTQVGNDIFNQFNPSAFPMGMVNRVTYNNSKAMNPDLWAGHIEDILEHTRTSLNIILSNDFSTETLTLSTSVTIQTLDTISLPLVLSVYLVEDSIKDVQEDYATSQVIKNYIHRNVLRGALNGSWGEDMKNALLPKGTIILKSYSYTHLNNALLNKPPKYSNVYTITFVYNRKTYEVLQCQKAKIY